MKLTVYQDAREKRPLLFPANIELSDRTYNVEVVKKTLNIGDYTLDSDNPSAIIERKGSIDELHQNLFTRDRARFTRSLVRMGVSIPRYLLLDFAWHKGDPKHCSCKHTHTNSDVLDALWDVVVRYGLRVISLGDSPTGAARRNLGSQLLRLLWSHDQIAKRERAIATMKASIGVTDGNGNLPS